MKMWDQQFLLFHRRAIWLLALAFFLPAISPAQDASHSPGWVVIPVDEYQNLRARAYPAEHPPELPPVDATLTRVDYDLHINGDLAMGRASLTVDVLKDGWVRVSIPSGLLVREARLEGKPVSLLPSEPGKAASLSAVLSRPGRSVLLLDVALPVISSAGEERIVLPSTHSGVTRAAVELPLQGVDLTLDGGLLTDTSESPASPQSAGSSKWLAYGSGNEPLRFIWRKKLDEHKDEHKTDQPLRLRDSLVQMLGLGEDLTTVSVEANIDVLQGAARQISIQLPDSITVNQVSGSMVADWEAKDGKLSVSFLEPVEQSTRFVISGEARIAREGKIDIPVMRLLDAERETGGVAIEVLGAGEIKDLQPQGMEVADASELGQMVENRQSPSLAAFRFNPGGPGSKRSLSIDIARYAQQSVLLANIEEARYRVLATNEGKILVQARYAVRNNQKNFLKVTLPPNATLWSAALRGRAVRPGQSPDGAVLLPLEKYKTGDEAPAFAVEVLYLVRDAAWNEKGAFRLALPALDLPISRTGLELFHSPFFRVTAGPGPFTTQAYQDPSSPVLGSAQSDSGEDSRDALKPAKKTNESRAMQDFAQSFWTNSGGRTARVLPVNLSFPAFGTSVFLVSELTAESHAETLEFNYQREKKAGGQ